MCDFSLQSAKSRDAKVADKLVSKNFGYGTRGFADAADADCAVCLKPGTEIGFSENIKKSEFSWIGNATEYLYKTAIFRQLHKDVQMTHHDALELPDGTSVLLTHLVEGQTATVLQLPAQPKNEQEAKEQQRLETVG